MSRRYKDSRRKPSRATDEEENFVDSLQSDQRSEAESSALSSVLPIITSSQVRASAPRASMPDAGSTGMSSNGGSNMRGYTKKSDDIGGGGSTMKDMDEYTVETNRPIDSVYIYPSSPKQTNHRQRRNYRSGQRSSVDGTASRGSSVGNFSTQMSQTGSVGGILETLGLGSIGANSVISEGEDIEDDTLDSKRYKSRDYYSRSNKRSLGTDQNGGPQVHIRAALVLFFLMSILYGAFQWISMSKTNSLLLKSKQNKRAHSRHYKAFAEGEDRPVDKDLVGKITSIREPSQVSQKLAKVPKHEEGPAGDLDSTTKKKLYIEAAASTSEKAPADTLEGIDKKVEEVKTALSLAVESGLAGVYTKDPSHADLPFLWYVPRSGGGMLKNILSNCKGLILASEVGATVAKVEQTKLEIIDVGGFKYLNVDTTTEVGISKAKALGLASSGMANLVISPRMEEAASLFGPSTKGRAFTMLRHPVERAVSMFYFLKKHNVPAVASMELEDYCKSPHIENNWMVRMLSDKMTGDVTEDDLDTAKKLLREKVVIGLLEQKEESMRRFEYHFGWRYTENPQRQSACRTRILVGDYRTNESSKGKVQEGGQAWSLLMWQNKLDMKLYKYAKALFLQQGTELFNDIP
mmetsp:Transcript_24642/g.40794  ORF Transcript_24642/g.40794 Transcript_24642/m.40794 type:complete len:634 (+) Transcript_24642:96-1997(+)|eukprot:CAMPEP_0119015436 /NCGR_PEP_ID=MMETSP1176-20130426/11003_1 /TAXON_ID=265551 /ORGANISM="Synedropsis recta cf, Strain CCMP1620" /LENGTH=633 /DNA_ID=CAMNT_0006968727 /DNA_START=97 /DNA_END=1998 /DNA_ORIENTATION=+